MKLTFNEKFSLEIPLENGTEEIITGTIRQLKRSEDKQLLAIYEPTQKKENELQKLITSTKQFKEKFDLNKSNLSSEEFEKAYNKINENESQIEKLTRDLNVQETILAGHRFKFDKTIISEQKERLKQICEDFGYPKVFDTIEKDIEEKKQNA